MLIDPNTRPNKLLRGCLVADLGGGEEEEGSGLPAVQPTAHCGREA